MSAANPANPAASIHARLLKGASERGETFNLTLTRYAVERFLYRMSVSKARDQFVLKGALLFDLWFDAPHRPSKTSRMRKRPSCSASTTLGRLIATSV